MDWKETGTVADRGYIYSSACRCGLSEIILPGSIIHYTVLDVRKNSPTSYSYSSACDYSAAPTTDSLRWCFYTII